MKTVLFLIFLCPAFAWAQLYKITPEDTQRKQSYLLMRDGLVVHGQILRQDSTIITVKKRNGDLSFVEADQVVRISPNRPDLVTNATPTYATVPYTVFVLKDGSQVEGKFVRRDSTMITVRKRDGRLTYFEPELLVRTDSVRMADSPVPAPASGRPAFTNRFSPFLLTGPTAYNPEKGRFYYRNTFLFLNDLYYGISRNWSVGASVNPFFSSIETTNTARETALGATVRFSSKLTFPIGRQVRIGVNATYQPRQRLTYYLVNGQWSLQGLASFGDSQRSATLSYGIRLYQKSFSPDVSFITAGVMHKLSRNLTFISDNTFYLNPYFVGASAFLSAALRFDRRRHAFDVGALASVSPYYGYVYSRAGNPSTRTGFSPYIGYNLLIGRD